MSFKEIMELKNDLLKNNRELETRLITKMESYNSDLNKNITNFKERINAINENNNKVINILPDLNFKVSKIEALEKFDQKIDLKLNAHEFRIGNLLTEIGKIKTKYDKIVLDNLYVPGHIGGGNCPFSNLSD